jgi:hypothetical protein
MTHPTGASREVQERADALARRLKESERPTAELDALLHAIRALDARFQFDCDGRPGAIEAVRHALPAMEADLFGAVIEDHGCEVAALTEAVWQLAAALSRSGV